MTDDDPGLTALRWQFDTAWALAEVHLPLLTDEACLWLPTPHSWTVHRGDDGRWRPDWSDGDPGVPASVGWISWQVLWWWSSSIAVLNDEPVPERTEVFWPGDATSTATELRALAARWKTLLDALTDDDLRRPVQFPWAPEWSRGVGVAWAHLELIKNIAEIGYGGLAARAWLGPLEQS